MCVSDMAIASNGTTIFIISDGILERSTNGGQTFTVINSPAGCTPPLRNVAIAPDNASIVMVSDNACGGNRVWRSSNNGSTWANMGIPQTGACTITDIAVSPAINTGGLGRLYICTIADNNPSVTTLGCLKMRIGSGWTNVQAVAGLYDYMAVQTSPNFTSDLCVAVVGATPSAGLDYQIINLNILMVMQTVHLVALNTTDYASAPGSTSILSADIVLDPGFNADEGSSCLGWVGIARKGDGHIFRINNTTVTDLIAGTAIKSVALVSGELIAGEYDTTRIRLCSNPVSSSSSWIICHVPPGERKAVVRSASNIFHAGTSGRNGGFF
jgi:hypothetical protein